MMFTSFKGSECGNVSLIISETGIEFHSIGKKESMQCLGGALINSGISNTHANNSVFVFVVVTLSGNGDQSLRQDQDTLSPSISVTDVHIRLPWETVDG